ncbi:hypothetical protein OHS33_01840 [Streptomyces sp. NBC_00536]|uniref:DUF6875 domain-containing protein n=1 Tax=Streptomyces sp. NBC_00536 TaxID=2975769 RepID=UPI002E818D13|nr:hypothetical protein [Streptomyces sp. NBC_00536]WUC77202.1 hypothetical protein OHS33_01840 [Streptomyces sp. NBC_00536]
MTLHDQSAPVAVLPPACPASVTERAEAVVQEWLRDYVSQPHEQLGRDGDVCPFVEPAARAGTLMMHTRTGLTEARGAELRALVREMARTFRTTRWPRTNPTMYAYVLILPDLPREQWAELDAVQAGLKAELAEGGLMLGQFHPECPEPAARNPQFPVSRSPVPLLAMRNMALHDVLFLHNDSRLFAEYQHRFGTRYERGAVADPLLRSSYEAGSAVG